MADQRWPADISRRRPTADLVPYARNSRTHSPEQIKQIAASMREFGVTAPVLVDEHDNIIAGHGRVMAAELNVRNGLVEFAELPTITAIGWSDAKKRAYVIADNKLALNAGWDNDILALEMQDLISEDFDLSLTGFDEGEIEALLPTEVGDLEANDFMPEEGGQTSPGSNSNALKFAGKVVPLSQDECDRLDDFLQRHIADRGVQYGFVSRLLDAATAGNF